MENIHKRILIIACGLVLCICSVLSGCAGSPKQDTGRDVSDYQRKIDALESTVRLYELRIEQAGKSLDRDIGELASVRERAQGIAGTVEELADLFDLYTEAVDRLIRDYRTLQKPPETAGQDTSDTAFGGGAPNSGNGGGLHTLRQGNKASPVAGHTPLR